MYGIIAKNTGMWGCSSWCVDMDGNTILFRTKEEAQKVADEYNAKRPPINCFTQYFASRYD